MSLIQQGPPPDRGKKWKTDLLMERIRSKNELKSLTDNAKAVRMALMDRRFALDKEEKDTLQQCLDRLQDCIKVRSAQGMAQRLDTIGRQLGLKPMAAPVHGCYYLSTEMFFVEINIDQAGNVKEAKIHHNDATQANQHHNTRTQNCPEIIECLTQGDFQKFISHLEGLLKVYNLPNASAIDKSRAWIALSNVEEDLEYIYSGYNRHWSDNDAWSFVHKSALGFLHRRQGGLPMQLRFFIPPYDLLDEPTNSLLPISFDSITERDLGLTVTVTLERSEEQRLMPVKSLINRQGNPMDIPISTNNCFMLPARFILELKHPMPLSLDLCKEIASLTDIAFVDESQGSPLLQLITKHSTDNVLSSANNRGLFVTLPDQQHCYFLTDHPDLQGALVSTIPFAHPSNVPTIIGLLRQQALFNTLIASCARINSIQDLEKSIMFEVTCLDLKHLSITFEHPVEECIATVELDLSDILGIRCRTYSMAATTNICPEELTNKVIQKSLSIPVTMRSIIRHGQQKLKTTSQEPDSDIPVGGPASNGFRSPLSGRITNGSGDVFATKYDKLESSRHFSSLSQAEDSFVRTEPMDFDSSANNTFQQHTTTGPLNECGPQDTAFNPGALQGALTAGAPTNAEWSRDRSTSKVLSDEIEILINDEPVTSMNNIGGKQKNVIAGDIVIKREPGDDPIDRDIEAISTSCGLKNQRIKPIVKRKDMSIKPSVSITPIVSEHMTNTVTSSGQKGGGKVGIEIIPLGSGAGSSGSGLLKPFNQELRRSLSEDDKRRLEKREHKKRKYPPGDFDKHSKKKPSSVSKDKARSESPNNHKKLKTGDKSSVSAKTKLASVIDRLSHQTADTGIEITPAKIGSTPPKDPGKDGKGSALKVTIKTPVTPPLSKPSGSSKSGGEYKKHSSIRSPSVSPKLSMHPKKSSSSSHKHSSSSSKSSSSSSKHSSSSSSKSRHGDHSRRREKEKERDKERREEEVKKMLSGHKEFNKTFQIPKLAKPEEKQRTSPSYRSNSTPPKASPKGPSPKYSPKQQPSNPSGFPTQSPKYIGGGTVTPPNISPKHHSSGYPKPDTSDKPPPPPSVAFMNLPRGGSESDRPKSGSPTVSLHITPIASPKSIQSPSVMDDAILIGK